METIEVVRAYICSETDFAVKKLQKFMADEYGKDSKEEKPMKKELIQGLTYGIYSDYDISDEDVPAFVMNWCNKWHIERYIAEVATVRKYFEDGKIKENMEEIIEIISDGYSHGMFKFIHRETFNIIYQEFKKDLPGRGLFGGLGDDLKSKLLPFIGEEVTTDENISDLAFFISENWQELLDVYEEDEA